MNAIGSIASDLIGFLYATLFGFVLPVLIVALAIRAQGRKRERLSRERLAAIEKGLEVPLIEAPRPRQRMSSHAGALLLIGIGIGLSVALGQSGASWTWGLIPGMIGLALLAYWLTGGKRAWERQRALDEELQLAYIDLLRRIAPAAKPAPAASAD
jgi:uncharacterized protein DUF6249